MKTISPAPNSSGICITANGNNFCLGMDFVDAVIGTHASHGTFETFRPSTGNRASYRWTSTKSISESEKAIRALARREGLNITFFSSQAI